MNPYLTVWFLLLVVGFANIFEKRSYFDIGDEIWVTTILVIAIGLIASLFFWFLHITDLRQLVPIH